MVSGDGPRLSGLLLWDRCLCAKVPASGSTAGLANRVRVIPVTLYMAERGSSGFRSMCRMNSLPIWSAPFGMAGIFRR